MLVQLQDGGILEISSDTWSSRGCDTCDYGSPYVNEYQIKMTSGTLEIEVDNMYNYALSKGLMMEVILPNVNEIKQLTEQEFIEWIKVKIEEKVTERGEEPEEFKYSFE